MFCKKCGTDNPDDYSFCKNCGFPLAKAEGESRSPEMTGTGGWGPGPASGDPDGTETLGGTGMPFEDDKTVAMTGSDIGYSPSRLSEERIPTPAPSEGMGPGPASFGMGSYADGRQYLPKKYKPVNAMIYFLLTFLFSFGVAALYIVFTFIYGGQKNAVLKKFWDDHFLVMIIILGVCAVCFLINILLALVIKRAPVKSFARGYLIVFLLNAALLAALAVLMHKQIIHYDVFSKLETFFV